MWANLPLPPPTSLIATLPMLILLLLPLVSSRAWEHWLVIVITVALCIVGLSFGGIAGWYTQVWNSVRPLVPVVTAVGCLSLTRNGFSQFPAASRRVLFLLLSMSAMVSLVQFPYSFGIYFCYVAPLTVLSIAALVSMQAHAPIRIHICILGFYCGFGILWMNPSHITGIGVKYLPIHTCKRTDIKRLGLRINDVDKWLYENVIREIHLHSKPSEYIYATADCPEIYFLAARKNPTRTFFDFFDGDYHLQTAEKIDRVERMIDERNIRVAVFSWRTEFSNPPSQEMLLALQKRLPNLRHFSVGTTPQKERIEFTVAWRD